MLDTHTLIIITSVTLFVTSLAILLSWVVNRRIRGAHFWSLGYFSLAGGVALQGLQGNLTPVLSIGLANTLISCGMYLTYVGVSQFQGRMIFARNRLLLLIVLVVLVHLFIGLGREGFAGRTLMISGLIAGIAYMIAYGFFRSESRNSVFAFRINGVIYFLLGCAFAVRALSIFFVPPQTSAIDDTPLSHYTYYMAIIFNILIAFSYLITLYSNSGQTVQRVVDTDLQTGLLNRQGLAKHADLLIKRVIALGGGIGAVFFEVRPEYPRGGEMSEAVYRRVMAHFAEKMLRCFHSDDLLGRISEHEFAAVVPYSSSTKLREQGEFLKRTFEANGTVIDGTTVYSAIDVVTVDSARVVTDFDDLLTRAHGRRNQPFDERSQMVEYSRG